MLKRTLVVFTIGLLAAGCSAPKKRYFSRPERSVAVIPPFHVKPKAWRAVWPHAEREMIARRFTVLPREEVEGFMMRNKFSIPREIEQYTTAELAKELKVDMILYTTVVNWDKTTLLVYNKAHVKIRAQLYAADGTLLYDRTGWATKKRHLSARALFLSAEKLARQATRNAFRRLLSVPPATVAPNTPPPEPNNAAPSREEPNRPPS